MAGMASTENISVGLLDTREDDWPAELLRSIWREQQHRLTARIAVIERATVAIEHDCLGEELRAQAQRAAHTLAGSIGIFGLEDAGAAAHALELELACPAPERTAAIRELLVRLMQAGDSGSQSL
jgi:chemotaxis protein histidine kinase CheA